MLMIAVYFETIAPPNQPTRSPMSASTGTITSEAASRGITSIRAGGMLIVTRASTSW